MNTKLINKICNRWYNNKDTPLLSDGDLISEDNQLSAHGDILHHECGWSFEKLRKSNSHYAVKEVAEILDISRTYSNLLREVNYSKYFWLGDVFNIPERFLGSEWRRILKFWKSLENVTETDHQHFSKALKMPDIFYDIVQYNDNAAISICGIDAWHIARCSVATNFGNNGYSAFATTEIQAHTQLDKLVFLPLFGFETIADLDAWEPA